MKHSARKQTDCDYRQSRKVKLKFQDLNCKILREFGKLCAKFCNVM